MKLSARQRRRYLLIPVPAVAALAIGAVAATSALADPAALEWTNTKTPDLGDYALDDVLALAADDAWTVGTTSVNGGGKAVSLHWNGTEWEDVAAPEALGLQDLTVAGEDVWTVGAADETATLTARWDGSAWETVPTPQPELPEGHSPWLRAVGGDAADDVWAVGNSSSPDYTSKPFMQHWNGTEWSLVDVPLPDGATDAGLTAVRAIAADDVWVTGGTFDAQGVVTPLLLHWDGKEWSQSPLPSPLAMVSISDINVTEDGRIWLAGSDHPDGDPFSGVPMLAVGDGKTWTKLEVPEKEKFLSAVEPDGSGGVVAVGNDGDKAMVLSSDGKTVTREAAPDIDPAADFSSLEGVSLVPGTETLWTVGFLNKFQDPLAAYSA